MARNRFAFGAWGVLAAALVISAGCNGGSTKPTVRLAGTVKIKGQPIPTDAEMPTIMFTPTRSGMSGPVSADIKDGRYEVTNAPKGSVLVTFVIQSPTGREVAFAPGARPQMTYNNLVPEDKRNGVTIEVTGDNTSQDFDL
jgi:hypothetical protein